MKSVQGKNVLVTGAAMGMGRLFAERAIAEGASAIVLWDVDEAALDETLAELGDGPCEVSGYVVDVSDAAVVADTAAAVLQDLDRIDVLVNNAGVVRGNHYFWETDLERDAKFTIDVNTLAPMYVAHAFLPAMIAASDDCRLLNLASAAGFTPNPRMADGPTRSVSSSNRRATTTSRSRPSARITPTPACSTVPRQHRCCRSSNPARSSTKRGRRCWPVARSSYSPGP